MKKVIAQVGASDFVTKLEVETEEGRVSLFDQGHMYGFQWEETREIFDGQSLVGLYGKFNGTHIYNLGLIVAEKKPQVKFEEI